MEVETGNQLEIIKLEVGQLVPPPFFKSPPPADGASFNVTDNAAAFVLIYLHHMSSEEKLALEKSRIETAYWHRDGFWVGLLKFGDMIQELSFDPMINVCAYGDFSPEVFRDNRLVGFTGIESSTMKVATLRAATYPERFLAGLYRSFEFFTPSEEYSNSYRQFINEVDSQPLPVLWQDFIPGGYFGEPFEASRE